MFIIGAYSSKVLVALSGVLMIEYFLTYNYLSPSTVRYLRLVASWTPSDYLYLVEVLHRHLLNL